MPAATVRSAEPAMLGRVRAMANDREAVDAAIATIGPVDSDSLRLVHITNTKDLATLEVSTALLAECAERDDLTGRRSVSA